ncbi:hypothetical protein JOQ06_026640, partial [Pogonophryne albipinna]
MSHAIPKTQDKSRHQRICLAAVSISRKIYNWTLLSAGFDVGEEADGGSRTTETPSERERGVGLMNGIGSGGKSGHPVQLAICSPGPCSRSSVTGHSDGVTPGI